MKKLLDFTDRKLLTFLQSTSQYDAVKELASLFTLDDCSNKQSIIDAIVEREQIMSTGIGYGIALPHIRNDAVEKLTFALGVSKQGIEYDSMDKKPVHLMIAVIAKKDQHFDYLKLVSRIVAQLNNDDIKSAILDANTIDDIWQLLDSQFS